MQVRRNSWRALPTLVVVIVALALGAASARADAPAGAHHAPAADSSSAAIR